MNWVIEVFNVYDLDCNVNKGDDFGKLFFKFIQFLLERCFFLFRCYYFISDFVNFSVNFSCYNYFYSFVSSNVCVLGQKQRIDYKINIILYLNIDQ